MKIVQYVYATMLVFLLCYSSINAQTTSIEMPTTNRQHLKLGTITGIIKNESNIVLNFTSTTTQKGLYLTLHEIFEYPLTPSGKGNTYEFDMGKELQDYTVQISKVNENVYSYKIYNVPLQRKFLIRCNTSNLDNNTAVSTLANLNFIGAITYIIQKGFGVAKYMELVNIVNTSGTTITKNIFIKN